MQSEYEVVERILTGSMLGARSSTRTSMPCFLQEIAAARPPRPAPTITTFICYLPAVLAFFVLAARFDVFDQTRGEVQFLVLMKVILATTEAITVSNLGSCRFPGNTQLVSSLEDPMYLVSLSRRIGVGESDTEKGSVPHSADCRPPIRLRGFHGSVYKRPASHILNPVLYRQIL
jgi:hypothetical protein